MKPYLSGLIQLTPGDTGRPFDLSSYASWTNQYVDGFRMRLSWGKIAPTQTTRNWALLDQALSLAQQYGKRLSVSIVAGFNSPPWIYSLGVQSYANADGSGVQPLPWDTVYQGLWASFLHEFAQHVPPSHSPSLSPPKLYQDSRLAEVICCGFMTEAGMTLGDATDESQMPHPGFATVHDAYRDAAQRILAVYQTEFPTTPLEITYTAPFPTSDGQADGVFVKNWFSDTYAGQAGSMVSSVYATTSQGAASQATFPKGGQCFQQCYQNPNPAGLYTPTNNSAPAFPQTFVDMSSHGAELGDQKLECYTGDLVNAGATVLAAASAKLKANVPAGH